MNKLDVRFSNDNGYMCGAATQFVYFTRILGSIASLLYSNRSKGPDMMRWQMRGTGTKGDMFSMVKDLVYQGAFDVRSYNGVLSAPREIYFPWRGIWCAKAPKQVAFLCEQQCGGIF